MSNNDNKHDSTKIGLVIDIKLTCEDKSEYILKSQNISNNGAFLDHSEQKLNLSPGSQVILEVYSQLDEQPAPPVKAEITRITEEGIELKFLF